MSEQLKQEQQIEKRLRTAALFDFYSLLLTEKQREVYVLFYEEDLSLGEIAAEISVSRQAVYDNLKRTETLLENYESALHLYEHHLAREDIVSFLEEKLSLLRGWSADPRWEEVFRELNKLKEE